MKQRTSDTQLCSLTDDDDNDKLQQQSTYLHIIESKQSLLP